MAGFLRKKSKQDQRFKAGSVQAPRPSSPPTATPLFARFATSKQAQEGTRIVSSPMLLSSARKDAPSHHNNVRGIAPQAAVQSQQHNRDGNPRGPFSQENNGVVPGGNPSRVGNRVAAAPLQNPSGGTQVQQDQVPRPRYSVQNSRSGYSHQPSQPQPSHPFDRPRGQIIVQPGPHQNTRPVENQHQPSDHRVSILDKPLPPPVENNSSHLNGSAPPSDDQPSHIQGEYAHLWSMIVGDDVKLPDMRVGSTVNPASNTPTKPLAQETPTRNRNSNVPFVSTSVSGLDFQSNSPSSGTARFGPPIASQPTLNEPAINLRPPFPQSDSPPRQVPVTNAGSSAALVSRTTSYLDSDEKPSKPQKSYENANINDSPVTPQQNFDSAPLTTLPNANRKLSKSTKPAGQHASITRSPSTMHKEDANRPSQPAQDEVRRSYYPTSDNMGANVSSPEGPGIHLRPLNKEAAMMAPSNQRSPPTAFVASPRMSVQYSPTLSANSSPRKSSSVRSTTGNVKGKPLIFTAMAAVDQNRPLSSAPNLSAQQQQQQPQHPPSPPVVVLPPRRDSMRPNPHTPPQPYPQLRAQPVPVSYAPQAGPSAPRPSSASQHSVTITAPHLNGPHHGSHSPSVHHESPIPPVTPIHQSPSRTRRPSKSQASVDHAHNGALGSPGLVKVHPTTPISQKAGPIQVEGDTLGVPLDDDPFAKAEGVKMLMPTASRPPSPAGTEGTGKRGKSREELLSDSASFDPSRPASSANLPTPSPMSSEDELRRMNGKEVEANANEDLVMVSPPLVLGEDEGSDYLTAFLSDPKLLRTLLSFFTFYDWCMILSLSRDIRFMIVQNPLLRETVLERFLKTVGYSRWGWNESDPLSLSLQDLNDYMRGVSTPTHEYARIAALYNHSLFVHPSHRDHSLYDTVRHLAASCRAYTRVVLRLRAQGEKEVAFARAKGTPRSVSRPQSRSASPTFSHSNHSHASVQNSQHQQQSARPSAVTFQSPLFRLKRAPLLRVFVPSPDGDWLSDKSVLECESELRRAGVMGLLRLGDVVWDVAVGDEGNVGRLAWDGSYLIDLDYTYSPVGDLPKYMPTLAFPPSYFHRVIRTGPSSSNPIAHIDLRPWGEEIATNLQLLQDRVRTETPQGAYHNVVRWVHRSSFVIRPPGRGAVRSPMSNNHHSSTHPGPPRFPIPESNLFVDPGWYGTIVVETEGTNESLADLQDRCGPGAFPPRPTPVNGVKAFDRDSKLVFRILREKSRPGEIWIRTVSPKERIL